MGLAEAEVAGGVAGALVCARATPLQASEASPRATPPVRKKFIFIFGFDSFAFKIGFHCLTAIGFDSRTAWEKGPLGLRQANHLFRGNPPTPARPRRGNYAEQESPANGGARLGERR